MGPEVIEGNYVLAKQNYFIYKNFLYKKRD